MPHRTGANEPQAIQPTSLIFTPTQVYNINVVAAVAKDKTPLPKLVLMGVMCGMYVGLGYSTCCVVGGLLSPALRADEPGLFNFLFAIFGFPMALTLIVFTGGDLFTGNCMYTTSAVLEGRLGLLGALRLLVTSWLSNLAGCLLLMGLFLGADVFKGREDFLVSLAWKKCTLPWGVAFLRGVLANFMVCLAVWLANCARDFSGKFIGIWLPISSFVALGFEHSIANQFLIPTAMATTSRYDNPHGVISIGRFLWWNQVPVTLGNFVGGAVLMACVYSLAYGTPGQAMDRGWERLVGRSPGALHRVASAVSVQLFRLGTLRRISDGDEEESKEGETESNV